MALAPRVDGALRVASGSAWATWDGEWGASPGDSGDFWLREGDELPVPGGRRLVLEAFGSELRFSWDPVAAPRGALSRVKRALGARA